MIPIVPKTRETRSNNVTFYESSASPPGTASPGLSEPRKKGSDPFFFFTGWCKFGKIQFLWLFFNKEEKEKKLGYACVRRQIHPLLAVASSLTVWNFKGMHDFSELMTDVWAKTYMSAYLFLKFVYYLLTHNIFLLNWYWDGTDAIPVNLYFSYRQKYINETNSNFQIQHKTMNTSTHASFEFKI